MSYNSNYLKWQAFKYKDPFAADKFFVCNSKLNICCRPNCELSFNSHDNISDDIIFFDNRHDVIKNHYKFCPHCLPNLKRNSSILSNENYVLIDLDLLASTIKNVNKKIGLLPPLFDDNRKSYINAINQLKNIKLKNKLLQYTDLTEHINNEISNDNSTICGYSKVNPSKSDLEHLKLIDMACKHIALAALSTIFGLKLIYDGKNSNGDDDRDDDSNERESHLHQKSFNIIDDECNEKFDNYNDDDISEIGASFNLSTNQFRRGSFIMKHLKLKKKKRRGGVLGFKDLASKSQLSPWHFHRTFKSMTGITPKQYGDKCFKYLDFQKDKLYQSLTNPKSIIINAKLANPSFNSNNESTTQSEKSSIVSIDSEITEPKPNKVSELKEMKEMNEVHEINELNDLNALDHFDQLDQLDELNELDELDESYELDDLNELNDLEQFGQTTLDFNSFSNRYSTFNPSHSLPQIITTFSTLPSPTDNDINPNTPASSTSLNSAAHNYFHENYSLDSPQKLPEFSNDLKPNRFYYINSSNNNNESSASNSNLFSSDNSHSDNNNDNNNNNSNFNEFYKNLEFNESPLQIINDPINSDIDNQILIKQLQLQNLLEKRINDQQIMHQQQNFSSFFTNTLIEDEDAESVSLNYFNFNDLNNEFVK